MTATPVTYVVQAGDTLLQIARQFGVTLSNLQSANGGIEPISLQIGKLLVIPSPQFNAEGAPILPTSTPLSIYLPPPTCYAVPTEYIVCLGRVTNSLDEAVERVTVYVELVGEDGDLLISGESAIEQSIIPAGETAPYRLLFRADWSNYAGALVRLESADSVPGTETRFIPMDVEDQDSGWVGGRYAVNAMLHNPSEQNVRVIRAVVTLWDEDGNITGYRVARLDQMIAPGERIPFEIAVMSKSPATSVRHSVYLEAVRDP